MSTHDTTTLVWCSFCDSEPNGDDDVTYLINSQGNFGLPEAHACRACMLKAEPGSYIAKRRRRDYWRDFYETQPELSEDEE